MPFVEIPADNIRLYYRTNLHRDDVSRIDPRKPTIIFLHGLFLDSTFIPQFSDRRLNSNFNLIAFDLLSCGFTSNPVRPDHDTWVEAAIIALGHEALQLPPCHIFATQIIAISTALRLTMLYPEKCLSLSLCGASCPTDLSWAQTTLRELVSFWCFAEDQEEFDDGSLEVAAFLFNERNLTHDEFDELTLYWETYLPPSKRTKVVDICSVILTKGPDTAEELGSIAQPVLILHGDSAPIHTIECIDYLRSGLTGVQGGVRVEVIRGGPECLSYPNAFAPTLNEIFLSFLDSTPRQQFPRSGILPLPSPNPTDLFRRGLFHLARFAHDSTITTRSPLSAFSFSRVPPEKVTSSRAWITEYAKDERRAFTPDTSSESYRK
ncbi:hypothetical protein BOTBODRAFT_56608 [Botryobasidium botryosum FD-172 SS1]|uniref:AB hydrolase-1 domain-containing protein n=1 Tax=Botryobasidium botryosum (strain FD-172 SS1) TaxID=930990 RepID=A0A067MMP9_BOTB1|nr:hypothetical protein BOTBODRAFT_56608 [Botryobasidium botryosum FD-172 SS1]